MAGGPSPSSTSPPDTSSPFVPSSLSSSASSPPSHSSPTNMLSASALVSGPFSSSYTRASVSPINERRPADKSGSMLPFSKLEPSRSNPEAESLPTVLIRRLPRSTTTETLRSMLLFAKDLIDVDFVPSEYVEDQNHIAAVARFKTPAGAHEAQDRLNGKANAAGDANMVVEIMQNNYLGGRGGRRRTIDLTAVGASTGAGLPVPAGNGNGNRQTSRYGGTFQSMEKYPSPGSSESFPPHDVKAIFSPRSPLIQGYGQQNDTYTSSKAMINEDAEDETGKIIANPVEYAKNGENTFVPSARRQTNTNVPVSAFSNLSLNTKGASSHMTNQQVPNYGATRNMGPMQSVQSPASAVSPHTQNTTPSSLSSLSNVSGSQNGWHNVNPYTNQRHPNYPPVNPADQNPPCNTLYVGNLPLDTSEDELKAMFSKQRGYKRLCFRTKQNGPMCFVEFEDISFATKALNELYGQPLHNSVKGGIRLSFSKNPLGVRTGQTGANGGLPGHNGMGMGIPAPPGFSNANGPPPGLSAPPGLASPNLATGAPMMSNGFGAWAPSIGGVFPQPGRAQSISSGPGAPSGISGVGGEYGYGLR